MFAHGFNVRFGTLDLPADIDVSMIAPKSPGTACASCTRKGAGTPALLAVHQDASGRATALALSYAKAIGVTRAGVLETTFAEETETGSVRRAGRAVRRRQRARQGRLRDADRRRLPAGDRLLRVPARAEADRGPDVPGRPQLHALLDQRHRGARRLHGRPALVTEETRAEMRRILAEIQDGTYARRWIAEDAKGRPWFNDAAGASSDHPIEQVGARLRAMMPFLEAAVAPDTDPSPEPVRPRPAPCAAGG
jgi:ketol-acid reductoisomerase